MASLNNCRFIGNAGANPEVRSFDNGNKIANIRLALSERYTDREGQVKESTEWIPLVFNGKLADIAERFIQKGSQVYVEGKWKTRKWTDQQGNEHASTEVRVDMLQLLGQRQQQGPVQPAQPAPPQYQQIQNKQPQYQRPQQAPASPQYPKYQKPVEDLPLANNEYDPELVF